MSLIDSVAAEAARAALNIIESKVEDFATKQAVTQRVREMISDEKLLLRHEAQELLDARHKEP